jgi:hypothetical protein
VRYRAFGRTAAKGAVASFTADFAALLPLGTGAQEAVDWTATTVFLLSCAALVTWVILNLGRPAEESGAVCREAAGEDLTAGQYEAAVRRAAAAGTLSVNGRRCVSRSPVTPRHMTGLTATARVTKSECDGCGAPLDVAWCASAAPYLCGECQGNHYFRKYGL